jgi:hypothetical protein
MTRILWAAADLMTASMTQKYSRPLGKVIYIILLCLLYGIYVILKISVRIVKTADINHLLRDKRVFVSNRIPAGKATLVGECGKVMAVVGIAELTDYLLALTDTVCLNHSDAGNLAERGRR